MDFFEKSFVKLTFLFKLILFPVWCSCYKLRAIKSYIPKKTFILLSLSKVYLLVYYSLNGVRRIYLMAEPPSRLPPPPCLPYLTPLTSPRPLFPSSVYFTPSPPPSVWFERC